MARYYKRGGARSIAEVQDVRIETPQSGQFLSYDDATGSWVNETPEDLGIATSAAVESVQSAVQSVQSAVESKPNLVNTDGDSGNTIYIGSVDPSTVYSLNAGDVWIDNS